MKNAIIIFIFSTLPMVLFSQPGIEWQKCFGGSEYDRSNDILHTNDGGYVVIGHTLSLDGDVSNNNGLMDIWMVKVDNFGVIQWEKNFGGGDWDSPNSFRQTGDGGYIIVGVTYSNDGDVIGNHGDQDAWILKLDSVGVIEWQRALGGSLFDEANWVEITPDGGYIVACSTNSDDGDVLGKHAYTDFWVLKLSSTGAIEWQKCLGGNSDERALSIKLASDGGYIVVGETLSNDGDVTGNNGDSDFWVAKLSISGEIEWQSALGEAGLDVGTDVVETSDGFVVCGYLGTINYFDYWIVKLSKTGDLLWQKVYGGTGPDHARSIIQTSDGNFVVAGESKSTDGDVGWNNGIQIIWVLKLNPLGELIWKKQLGGTKGEGCFSIIQTNDQGYILGGFAWSNDGDVSGNHGSADYWVIKLSPESVGTEDAPAAMAGNLEIYPNPAHQFVSLKTVSEEPVLSVRISDLLGRAISHQSILNPSTVEMDISALPSGLYLVTATSPSGRVYVGKMGKE
ncbi:MAG: T9SS type A sorting domain-containing protein [Saprospiraceae bacterium]